MPVRAAVLARFALFIFAGIGFLPGLSYAVPPASITSRFNHTVTLLPDGNLLIVGGETATGVATSSVELFRSSENAYVALTSLNFARSSHTATLLADGRVMVAGGAASPGTPVASANSIEIYDPSTNLWTNAAADLTTARYNHTAVLISSGSKAGRVLIVGGRSAAGTVDRAQICPPTGPCEGEIFLDTALGGREGHTATLLPNGDVLIAGGFSSAQGYLISCKRFLANTAVFSQTTDLFPARAWHAAALMGDGNVLISGGYNALEENPGCLRDCTRGFLRSSAIYAPPTGTWLPAANSISRRAFHTSSVLPDGRVVLLGGAGTLVGQLVPPFTLAGGSGVAYTVATTTNVNTASPSSRLNFNLLDIQLPGVAANGRIAAGRVDISSASALHVSSGTVDFTTGRLDLAGQPVAGGRISVSAGAFTLLSGTLTITAQPSNSPWAFSGQTLNTILPDAINAVIDLFLFADAEAYNPALNQWNNIGVLPVSLVNHAAVLQQNGDIRMLGGQNEFGLAQSSSAFLAQSNNPWSTPSPNLDMTLERSFYTATVLPDGRVLAAGGATVGGAITNTAELFNPALNLGEGGWQTTRAMGIPRNSHTAALLANGTVLVAGGNTTTGTTSYCEIFFPLTGAWVQTGSMLQARQDHTATLLPDGNVLVAGGFSGGTYLSSTEVYVSTKGVWEPAGDMTEANGRANHTASLLQDGRVLVVGGLNPLVLNSAETFNYVTRAWTLTAGTPLGARYRHTATMLPGGRILISGGANSVQPLSASVAFRPFTNDFVSVAAKPVAAYNHTATLLPSGKVLFSGGINNSLPQSYLRNTESYSLQIDSFVVQRDIPVARSNHTAVLLSSGAVLACGGQSSPVDYRKSCETMYFSYVPDARRPAIVSVIPAQPDRGAVVTVQGNRFHGRSEASGGGNGPRHSAANHPRVILQALDSQGGAGSQGSSGYFLDLTPSVYSNPLNSSDWERVNSSFSFTLPTGNQLPYGYYHLFVQSNGQASQSSVIQVGPTRPSAAPANLQFTDVGVTSVSWSWDAVANAEGYNVYSATSSIFVAISPTNSFIHQGLPPNSAAGIRVTAFNVIGDGPQSSSRTVFTDALPASGLTVSSVTATSLRLSWNANGNTNLTLYEVSYSPDLNFAASVSTPIPFANLFTGLAAAIPSLLADTTFYFRVRAQNGGGKITAFSSPASTQTLAALAGISGTPTGSSSIQWTWNTVGNATEYRVYNSTGPNRQLIATRVGSANTSFDQTGLSTNTARAVGVGVVTGAGEGPPTLSPSVFTLAVVPQATLTPLTAVSTGSFDASWVANGNPPNTLYRLRVFTVGGGPFLDTTLLALTANVPGLAPNTDYSVEVLARNGNGVETSFFSLGSTVTLSAPPSNVAVTGTSPDTVSIAWSANGNPQGTQYQVYRSTVNYNTNSDVIIAFSQNHTATNLTLSGLTTSTSYYLEVQSRNSPGQESGRSPAPVAFTESGGAPPGSVAVLAKPGVFTRVRGTLGFFPTQRTITLEAPPGAFLEPTRLTMSSSTALNCGQSPVSVSITADPPNQPREPIKFTLTFRGTDGVTSTTTVVMSRYHPATNRCVPLNTQLKFTGGGPPPGGEITVETNHLSVFQIQAVTPVQNGNLDGVRIWPNPFRPAQVNVTFGGLPANARVRIYTLHGEILFDSGPTTSSGQEVFWSVVNQSGRRVASGVYLAVVDSGSSRKVFKVAVER